MAKKITPRHQAREWVVQLLHIRDFNDDDEAITDFWDSQPERPSARSFAEDLYEGVLENLNEIDARLTRYADNWRLDRMGAVDRNVMRLALFEFFFRPDIPPVATLDEAIILAKELSSDESGRFVNGILDRAIKDLDRPLRSASKPDDSKKE